MLAGESIGLLLLLTVSTSSGGEVTPTPETTTWTEITNATTVWTRPSTTVVTGTDGGQTLGLLLLLTQTGTQTVTTTRAQWTETGTTTTTWSEI